MDSSVLLQLIQGNVRSGPEGGATWRGLNIASVHLVPERCPLLLLENVDLHPKGIPR